MIALCAILAICVVMLAAVVVEFFFRDSLPVPIKWDDSLIGKVIAGDLDSAERLSKLNGPQACEAMREVVAHSAIVEVKIVCIQGLARNKDFDGLPLLLKIMNEDDDLVDLRHQAYLAVRSMPGMVDRFYDARGPLEERREIVKGYRGDLRWPHDRKRMPRDKTEK